MLEDEEEEGDKDDKVIIFPALGTGCGRCRHDTVFTDSWKRSWRVWVQKIGQCCLSSEQCRCVLQRGRNGYKSSLLLSRAGSNIFLPEKKNQLVWNSIAIVKIIALTTVSEGQKIVLSWVLQISLCFGGRRQAWKNRILHELDTDNVIYNFQRIAQQKNMCMTCLGGHLNDSVITALA